MSKNKLYFIFVILLYNTVFSQENVKADYGEFVYQYGGYIKNSPSDNSIFPAYNNSFLLTYGIQTKGANNGKRVLIIRDTD